MLKLVTSPFLIGLLALLAVDLGFQSLLPFIESFAQNSTSVLFLLYHMSPSGLVDYEQSLTRIHTQKYVVRVLQIVISMNLIDLVHFATNFISAINSSEK